MSHVKVFQEKKIGIEPPPHKAPSHVCAPARSRVGEEQAAGMLRTPQQWLPRLMYVVESKGLVQNLRRCVEIAAIERQVRGDSAFELYLRTMRHRLVNVYVLALKLV